MSKPSDEDPAVGPPPDPAADPEPGSFGAAVTVPGGQSPFSTASDEADLTASRARHAHPPPEPADADFPGPPPSLDIPDEMASAKPPVKRPDKPESKFPEIDAAIRIVDVDTRPLHRRSTALNPWNIKTPGLGVEAKAALEALKEAQQPVEAPAPSPSKRRLFLLLALATGAAVVVFGTIIGVAVLRRGSAATAAPEPASAPLKLPEIPVSPPPLDEAGRVAKREAMIAAFDRHDFSQGILLGEELEAAKLLDAEAEFWLAEACRHANRPADAVQRYEGFIRDHPEHKLVGAAHYYAAEVARGEGKPDVARLHYKAVVADEKSGLKSKAKKRLQSLR